MRCIHQFMVFIDQRICRLWLDLRRNHRLVRDGDAAESHALESCFTIVQELFGKLISPTSMSFCGMMPSQAACILAVVSAGD